MAFHHSCVWVPESMTNLCWLKLKPIFFANGWWNVLFGHGPSSGSSPTNQQRGFLKMQDPKNHGFQYQKHLIWMIWGYPRFRKPPLKSGSPKTRQFHETGLLSSHANIDAYQPSLLPHSFANIYGEQIRYPGITMAISLNDSTTILP